MNVTIKDIAKLANVSHTTVSRALNDSPLINRETKERIRTIARKLNYTPNYNAKSLVLERSFQLGLFFTTLTKGTSPGFFHETVRGVNAVVKDQFNMIVKGIDDYRDFSAITAKNFDGIVVMSQSAADETFIDHLRAAGIPHVVLNRKLTGRRENSATVNIVSDDRHGAFRLVEYMLLAGHRAIALIEGMEGFQSAEERKAGYVEALRRYGIAVRSEYMAKGRYDLESGYEAMRRLLKRGRPTAVFCANDEMAVGAMKAAADAGLRVPDDLSVAGFDDNGFSGYLSPALTTVRRPIEAIARLGAQKLLEMVGRKPGSPASESSAGRKPGSPTSESSAFETENTLYLRTELVVRDSVRKLEPN